MAGTLSAAHSTLVRLSATEMAQQLADGTISSRDLIEAHIARIEAVDRRLNAVVWRRFDAARQEAEAADAARSRGQRVGSLAGVPMTIKECFHVAGSPATMGVHHFANDVARQDGALVHRLRGAGAVVLGKTNVPQLMLMHETDNPLYGRTNNPWDVDRSPGGSSGGEAAIIAAGGSPLGLGSDLGGSIRQPAHSCGICGLKPTSQRLTNSGSRKCLHGLEAIRSQAGPMARTVDDLWLALQVLAETDPQEIRLDTLPAPLGNPAAVRLEGMRVGVWSEDGFFPTSPAIVRAVREASAALERLGAVVVPFQPLDMEMAVRLYMGLISADGAADALRCLDESPRDWRMERLLTMGKSSRWLRRIWIAALRSSGQARTAMVLDATGSRTADEYWQLTQAKNAWSERFFDAWSAARLDAIVCPPHALPALKHAKSVRLAVAASNCYWANLLGVPAGVLPATRVRPGEDCTRTVSKDRVELAAAAVDADSVGLPVGVQVAARPWREDVVLAVMRGLEGEFRRSADFPQTPI